MLILLVLLSLSILNYNINLVKAEPQGNISFMPNVIPELEIHFVEEFFRFQWRENRFDLKLLIHVEGKDHSLKDFWELTDRQLHWGFVKEQATESMYEFGYMISDIPEEIADNVEFLVWKIEGENFDLEEIELEEIDTFMELGYNITNIKLPDNLGLSYQDLQVYNFTVSHPNKHETIVKGVKGKSSWNLDPVTFSGGVITILGYSEGSECDADDIVSGVGNTSIFAKHDDLQYSCDAVIVIGNDTEPSWVAFENIQLAFNSTCIGSNYENPLIRVENEGHLRFGKLINSDNKRTEYGVAVLDNEDNAHSLIATDANSELNIYGSLFVAKEGINPFLAINCDDTYKSEIYESIVDNSYFSTTSAATDLTFYRINQKGTLYGIRYIGGTMDDVYIHSDTNALYWHGAYVASGYSITNLKARNYTYLILTSSLSVNDDSYLINPDVDSWSFNWGGTNTAEIYRQYTFDLTVTYPNGTGIENANVTVKHYGQGETQDFTELTDSNGQISQKTLSMGFYNQTGGNTIYNYNPYELTVTYIDYQTYAQNFTLDNQITWEISLLKEVEIALQPGSGLNEYVKAVIVEPNIRGILIIIGLFAIVHWFYKWLTNKPKRWAKKAKITRY